MIRKKDLFSRIQQLEFDSIWDRKQIQHCNNNRKGLATIKQLQCAAKGHNFVFEKSANKWVMGIEVFRNSYQFKCTNCDLTIIRTIDELTPTEKKALKDLGILEEKNVKNPKTKTTN